MKTSYHSFLTVIAIVLVTGCTGNSEQKNGQHAISLEHIEPEKTVKVLVDGKLFTSLMYHEGFEKPFLFPVIAASGVPVTRGYPIDPQEGESTDHPHHTGFWFTYGNVNGIDFWGTSAQLPDSVRYRYGTIRLKSIDKLESSGDKAVIAVTQEWVNPDGSIPLEEKVTYTFSAGDHFRVIDRETNLKAVSGDLSFEDTKEGAFAIRVAKFLKFPSANPGKFIDAYGNIVEIKEPDTAGMTGNYLSSEGITGKEVWGTRAKWMNLYGVSGEDTISLILMDHPSNPNHPTYWHARTYGLFSANPFGVSDFTGGQEELEFELKSGEAVSFSHRLLIYSGRGLSETEINELWNKYTNL